MAYDSNDGVARLAAVLDARMRDHADKPLCLDFAEIQADGSRQRHTQPFHSHRLPSSCSRIHFRFQFLRMITEFVGN